MIKDLSGVSVSILVVTLALGAVISILVQTLLEFMRSHFNAQAESRQERRARDREERDESRQQERDAREEERQVEREAREEKRQIEREGRDEEGRRLSAARLREEKAALEIDRLLVAVAHLVPDLARSRVPDEEVRDAYRARREGFESLRANAAYLPTPVRDRVDLLAAILRHADEMESGRMAYHYDNVFTIAKNCAEEGHELMAAFLRHQPMPGPSKVLREYELSLQDLYRDKEWEFAPEIAEDEAARNKWLQAHPGYATALGEREPDPPPQSSD